MLEKVQRFFDRHGGDSVHGLFFDEDVARFGAQPAAAAGFARLGVEVAGEFLTNYVGLGVAVASLHVGQHAFESVSPAPRSPAVGAQVSERNLVLTAAIENHLANLFRQPPEGQLDVEAVMVGQAPQQLEVEGIAPVPASDGAGGKTQAVVVHHPLRIEELARPQPVTVGAGAGRVVEREQARFQFSQAVAAVRTGVTGREQ